jgi:hypothetical protein
MPPAVIQKKTTETPTTTQSGSSETTKPATKNTLPPAVFKSPIVATQSIASASSGSAVESQKKITYTLASVLLGLFKFPVEDLKGDGKQVLYFDPLRKQKRFYLHWIDDDGEEEFEVKPENEIFRKLLELGVKPEKLAIRLTRDAQKKLGLN